MKVHDWQKGKDRKIIAAEPLLQGGIRANELCRLKI